MSQQIVDKVVKWLFRESDLSLSFSEWIILAYVTIIKDSPQFSALFFEALAAKIQTSFEDTSLSSNQKEIILYNALSYIAFASPQEHQILRIKGIEYTIEKIALTSGWLSAPYYAYGLKVKDDSDAQSFLIFQGTTTPADHGFLAGVLADTRPHGAVGTQLYSRGEMQIQSWINAESVRTRKPVLCTGQSLGGVMSLHAHIHQPDQVDFFVINPPYLTHREKRIYEANPASDLEQRMLKVLTHRNDPVKDLGSLYLPKGTLVGTYGDLRDNAIVAHARSAECHANAPEVHFVPYEEQLNVNFSWKVSKVVLFLTIGLLYLMALPFRLSIKAVEVLVDMCCEHNPSAPETECLHPEGSLKSLSQLSGADKQQNAAIQRDERELPRATSLFQQNSSDQQIQVSAASQKIDCFELN